MRSSASGPWLIDLAVLALRIHEPADRILSTATASGWSEVGTPGSFGKISSERAVILGSVRRVCGAGRVVAAQFHAGPAGDSEPELKFTSGTRRRRGHRKRRKRLEYGRSQACTSCRPEHPHRQIAPGCLHRLSGQRAQVEVIGVLAWRVQRHNHTLPDLAPRQQSGQANGPGQVLGRPGRPASRSSLPDTGGRPPGRRACRDRVPVLPRRRATMRAMRIQRFSARVTADPRGRAVIVVPFDPDEAWGAKAEHHVNGTVNGSRVRGDDCAGRRRMGVHPEPGVDARYGRRDRR